MDATTGNNRTVMSNVTTQTSLCTASPEMLTATDIINFCMRSYIPIAIMLPLNIVLSLKFIKGKKRALTVNKANQSLRREYYFTYTVIVMNFTFFILYSPWSIWYAVNRVLVSFPSLTTPSELASELLVLALLLEQLLVVLLELVV